MFCELSPLPRPSPAAVLAVRTARHPRYRVAKRPQVSYTWAGIRSAHRASTAARSSCASRVPTIGRSREAGGASWYGALTRKGRRKRMLSNQGRERCTSANWSQDSRVLGSGKRRGRGRASRRIHRYRRRRRRHRFLPERRVGEEPADHIRLPRPQPVPSECPGDSATDGG